MHIICEKNTLAAALSLVQRAVANKSPLPTLKGVLMETKEQTLLLSATDLEFGIKCHIENQVVEQGAIVLPAKILTEFVRRLPDGMVIIKKDQDNPLKVIISSGKTKFDLSGFSPEEFPTLPTVKSETATIEIKEALLKEMFAQTEVAVARDDTRPILTGLLLTAEEKKLKLVATDGHRLAYRKISIEEVHQAKAVIPCKAILEMIKILEDSMDKPVSISIDDSNIVFTVDGITLSSRLVEGKYPPYQQIIPTEFKTTVVADTQELMAALERAEILVKDGGNNLVKLNINKGIQLSAVNQDIGSVEDFVDAAVEGEEIEILFNVRLLLDCLRNIKDKQVNLDLTGPYSPCMLRPVGDHNYLHLVLPVRIN